MNGADGERTHCQGCRVNKRELRRNYHWDLKRFAVNAYRANTFKHAQNNLQREDGRTGDEFNVCEYRVVCNFILPHTLNSHEIN